MCLLKQNLRWRSAVSLCSYPKVGKPNRSSNIPAFQKPKFINYLLLWIKQVEKVTDKLQQVSTSRIDLIKVLLNMFAQDHGSMVPVNSDKTFFCVDHLIIYSLDTQTLPVISMVVLGVIVLKSCSWVTLGGTGSLSNGMSILYYWKEMFYTSYLQWTTL